MHRIRTLNKISRTGLDKLSTEDYRIVAESDDSDAILLRSYKMDGTELTEKLKAVGRAGAGVNNIPVDKCTEKGIVVFNTPGANANAVKEIVLTGLFLASRKIVDGISWSKTQKGQGDDVPKLVEKNKSMFAGNEIKGKALGLIGLGAIGSLVANDASALGMNVEGLDPFITVDNAWRLSRKVKRAKSMESLLSGSDYISLHMPLIDDTRGFIDEDKFRIMKKGVNILNFSRGELVDIPSLKRALNDGTVSCYITDFPSDELLDLEGVIAIPHLGASTAEAEENCAVMIADQMMDFLENGNITNSVNFPNCSLDSIRGSRITIINSNVPSMVGQISTILADSGLNILNMLNKSRGDIAYNIVDVEGDVSDHIIKGLSAITGVIRVRKLIY